MMQDAMRSARSTGVVKLCNRGLLALPSCVFEENLCEDEKFWEVCSLTRIDLSHNLLTSIEGDWSQLADLMVVRLTHNRLTGRLPELLGQLPALHTLDASDNQLEALPRFASVRLRCVNVARNKLVEWPEFAGALEQLDATDNRFLAELPKGQSSFVDLKASGLGLRHMPSAEKMKTAHLARNQISLVSSWPLSLVYIDLRENRLGPRLDLTKCRASQILLGHNAIVEILIDGPLQNVSFLDISNNKLESLATIDDISAVKFPRLKTLDLSNNNLATLPSHLGFVTTLSRMMLHGNPLKSLRNDLKSAGCDKLKAYLRSRAAETPCVVEQEALARQLRNSERRGYLDLRGYSEGGEHIALEEEDKKLVRSVDISKSSLETLPTFITGLSSCHQISATDNKLSDLSSVFLVVPDSIQILDLKRNSLETPLNARPISSLVELDLAGNQLDSLNFIQSLSSLRRLLLSQNRLDTLGLGWRSMKHLECLDVKNNKLTTVGNIHEAPALRTLDLTDNDLASISPFLGLAPALTTLLLHGNPQRAIRTADLPKDTAKILARLRNKIPNQSQTFVSHADSSDAERRAVKLKILRGCKTATS